MKKYIILFFRIVVAIILLQTLRYKFTAHPDSIYIFTKVGLEPVGRIVVGSVELIAAILLLLPRTVWLGALLSAGVLIGAVLMHLTILGIEVNGDRGLLFYTAVFTLLLSLLILWKNREKIPFIGGKL